MELQHGLLVPKSLPLLLHSPSLPKSLQRRPMTLAELRSFRESRHSQVAGEARWRHEGSTGHGDAHPAALCCPQQRARETHSDRQSPSQASLPVAHDKNQVVNDQRSGRVVGEPLRPGEPALPVFCRPVEDHCHPTAASVTSVGPPTTRAPLNFAEGGRKALDRLQVDRNQTLWQMVQREQM